MALTRPDEPPPQLTWSGWGDPALKPALPDSVLTLLRDGLGVASAPGPPGPASDIRLPASRLDQGTVEAFRSLLGPGAVLEDDEARLLHTRGKSTPDLLRLRAREAEDAPDLILLPASHDEVLEVLRACSERSVAVVPYGGGSSVVGGLQSDRDEVAFAGVVALDLRHLNRLVELDELSRLATLEPGLRGPEAEALLSRHGYTIGHFPQSFEYASLGGFAAARSSGQASAGYGRFDELVVGLRVATPSGTLELGRAPRSAAGPDLRQLILGSEGAFGVITSLTVQVRPVPERRVYDAWRLDSFTQGLELLRGLAQDGPLPTVLRLSDEAETAVNLATPGEVGPGAAPGGCLLIAGYEGSPQDVEARREGAGETLAAVGASAVPGAGESWERDRYRGPYLRDALLDAGALVETLETVTFWSSVTGLYEAVVEALRGSLTATGTPPAILCHVSHLYRSGASLYFTVVCAQAEDPVSQWLAAKAAASDAIVRAGGSITHHHGVGRDHGPWYEQEIGKLGVDILRAVKSQLDPAGIMNPGVLVRRRSGAGEEWRS